MTRSGIQPTEKLILDILVRSTKHVSEAAPRDFPLELKIEAMKNSLGISTGANERLRHAVEEQVRREHEAELAASTDYWQRMAIEAKIFQELKRRMKDLASPQSLWAGQQ